MAYVQFVNPTDVQHPKTNEQARPFAGKWRFIDLLHDNVE